jgi:hypothetical protein
VNSPLIKVKSVESHGYISNFKTYTFISGTIITPILIVIHLRLMFITDWFSTLLSLASKVGHLYNLNHSMPSLLCGHFKNYVHFCGDVEVYFL